MTPITPPRAAERLLEALGAEPQFRDALLGDLAEELAIRASYDGARIARVWYWQQALRVAPYLLRDWARHLVPRHAARQAGIVGAACLGLVVVAWGALTLVEFVFERIGGPATFPWHDPQPGAVALCGMLLGYVIFGTTAGWFAARLDTRAPGVAALAMGATCSLVAVLAPLPARAPLPAWYLLGMAAAVLAGSLIGGISRIATRRRG